MEFNKNKPTLPTIEDPYFDELKNKTGFSFDFVLWFYRILKYWYLFAISVVFCWYISDLRNRSFVPIATVEAVLLLEEQGTISPVAGAVPLGTILRSTVNQQIVLKNRQMVVKTVESDSFPKKMFVDYFVQGVYKSEHRYSNTPVEIEILQEPHTDAYYYTFNLAYINDKECRIFYDGNELVPAFSIVVEYGKVIEDKRFKIKLHKTPYFSPHFETFSFNFLSKETLINRYAGRLQCNLIDPQSTVLNVWMQTSDPGRDKEYLAALLTAFQEYNLELKNQQATQTIEFIDRQSGLITRALNESREDLQKFQLENNIYEVNSPTLRDKIKNADALKDEQVVREKALLAFSDKINQTIYDGSELISPEVFEIRSVSLQKDITEYNEIVKRAQDMGTSHLMYEKTIDRLTALRASILKEMGLILSVFQEEKENLAAQYKTLEFEIRELPPKERALINLERIARTNEMYEEYLRRRREEASMQKNSNVPDNRIFQRPRVTDYGFGSSERERRRMFYLMLGLVVPLAFVIAKEEFLSNFISTKEDCEKMSGLPVIGTIENIAKKLKAGVVLVKNYPRSSFAESFRNMRVRIEYMAQRENNISMMVTSAEPGDGKTFIATNLASVYQLMGKKVVLVDLDLRRPSVSKTLKIETYKGVSNFLIGQITLDEAIISNTNFGFDIIPAGTLPPNPSELIKSEKTMVLLNHLREIYDYVVVDCSPVGLVSDAYILSKMIDVPLFVVRRNKTNKSFFKSVVKQVKFDMQNVSLVFNDVKGREGYYGTSRYYGNQAYYLKKKNSYYHDDYFDN